MIADFEAQNWRWMVFPRRPARAGGAMEEGQPSIYQCISQKRAMTYSQPGSTVLILSDASLIPNSKHVVLLFLHHVRAAL